MWSLLHDSAEKGITVVFQIARSAGWGGQKAEPTTSSTTVSEGSCPGASPYPPGILFLIFRVQKNSVAIQLQREYGQEPRDSL
jgi:hypothetical protein